MCKIDYEKSVKDVLKGSYQIPAYQRGYRWNEKQVKDLITDLYDYYIEYKNEIETDAESIKKHAFYCMQGLIIKQNKDGKMNVVDGQQRLTTMFILASYLNKTKSANLDVGEIVYEAIDGTDHTSQYLKRIKDGNIETDKSKADNRSVYYMINAYNTINSVIEEIADDNWLLDLINLDLIKFIFQDYSGEKIEEEDIFTSINTGKIALTDAELVRAKLLINLSDENEKDSYSKEWDIVEHALQNDVFWYFLQNDVNYTGSRINFLFELLAIEIVNILNRNIPRRNWIVIDNGDGDEHKLYRFLNTYRFVDKKATDIEKKSCFEKTESVIVFWDHVKELYEILNKWYEDVEIFNYVGQISYSENDNNITLVDLIEKYKKSSRYEFIKELKNIINKSFVEDGKEEYLWPQGLTASALTDNNQQPKIFSCLWYSGRSEAKEDETDKEPKENKEKVISFLLWSNCEYLNVQLKHNKFRLEQQKKIQIIKNVKEKNTELSFISSVHEENYRFPFEYFKTNKPDVEHIASFLSEEESDIFFEKKGELDQWCANVLSLISDDKLNEIATKLDTDIYKDTDIPQITIDRIKNKLVRDNIINNPKFELFTKDEFKSTGDLYKPFIDYLLQEVDEFKTNIDIMPNITQKDNNGRLEFYENVVCDRRKIGNLVLLDLNINRGYRNYPFRIKRRDFVEKSWNGVYVYPCTKLVFLKAFDSNSTDLLNWNTHDFLLYRRFLANLYYDCFIVDQEKRDKDVIKQLEAAKTEEEVKKITYSKFI